MKLKSEKIKLIAEVFENGSETVKGMDKAIAISDRKTSNIGVKDKVIHAFELLMMKRGDTLNKTPRKLKKKRCASTGNSEGKLEKKR